MITVFIFGLIINNSSFDKDGHPYFSSLTSEHKHQGELIATKLSIMKKTFKLFILLQINRYIVILM